MCMYCHKDQCTVLCMAEYTVYYILYWYAIELLFYGCTIGSFYLGALYTSCANIENTLQFVQSGLGNQ